MHVPVHMTVRLPPVAFAVPRGRIELAEGLDVRSRLVAVRSADTVGNSAMGAYYPALLPRWLCVRRAGLRPPRAGHGGDNGVGPNSRGNLEPAVAIGRRGGLPLRCPPGGGGLQKPLKGSSRRKAPGLPAVPYTPRRSPGLPWSGAMQVARPSARFWYWLGAQLLQLACWGGSSDSRATSGSPLGGYRRRPV